MRLHFRIWSSCDLRALIAVAVIIALAGCGSTTKPVPEFIVEDQRESAGTSTVQIIPIHNNSDAVLATDFQVRKDYRHSIELDVAESNISDQVIRTRIYELYGIQEISDTKSCLVPIEVPPGTKHDYKLEITEGWREGFIDQVRDGASERLGTYRILSGLDCQVVGVDVAK